MSSVAIIVGGVVVGVILIKILPIWALVLLGIIGAGAFYLMFSGGEAGGSNTDVL